VIKLRILRWRDNSGLSRWAWCKTGQSEDRSRKRRHDLAGSGDKERSFLYDKGTKVASRN
jgi:hypothetical protein